MATSTLQRLQAFAEQSIGTEGNLAVQWTGKDWLLAAEWGQEAPDSPMAGAASYGSDDNVEDCIEEGLKDPGFGPEDSVPVNGLKSKDQMLNLLDEHIRSYAQNRINATEYARPDLASALAGEAALQRFREAIKGETLDVDDLKPITA